MEQSSMGEPNIPVDIITNILSRLPFETLVRCRSVCKLWYNIMKDPHFVYSHLLAPPGDLIYFASYRDQTHINFLSFNFHLLKLVTTVGEPYKVWKKSDNATYTKRELLFPTWFVGSCKGLVCYMCKYRKNLLIMNPLFLNDILTVPLPKRAFLIEQGYLKPSRPSCSFGFDEASKCFKVIYIPGCGQFFTDDSRYFSTAPLVLDLVMGKSTISSSKFCWRALSDSFPCTYFNFRPVFVDGAILFWGLRPPLRSIDDLQILSLDMGTEIFKIIRHPMSGPQTLHHLDLFDFDGRVGLIWCGRDETIRIWSLISDDEDNNMNKWVEEFQFKTPYKQYWELKAIGFDKKRCDLIFHFNHYFAYNTQTGITSPLPDPPGLCRYNILLPLQGSLVCASNLTPLE